MTIGSAFALDFTTDITEFKMHPDFWAGFLPSYIAYKFNLNLFQFIPQRNTEVSVTLSTGIMPRTITQNPLNGDPLWIWKEQNALGNAAGTSALIEAPYDTMAGGWSIRFGQGFGESVEPKKDMVDVWISFDGQWEKALNPILQLNRAGHPFDEPVFDDTVVNDVIINANKITGTPDLAGDQEMLSMSFNIGADFNMLNAKTARLHGLNVATKFTWAPAKLGSFFSGKADYIRLWLRANAGYTLFEDTDSSGYVRWSLVIDDQMEIRVLSGSAVPKFAETTSNTVWGLTPDNMTFFGRNSLKLHYYGQQFLKGLCVPSAYIFIDLGYTGGYLNNSAKGIKSSFWTGSAGINLDLQMFEILHIYYELGYIFLPGNDESKKGFSIPSMLKFLVKINF